MTPDEFVRSLQTRAPAPAYLFLGPESYGRDRCRQALIEKALPPEDRESGFIRHDLDDVDLVSILDDAQSFSLFASSRIIWVTGAESALPRGRASANSGEDGETGGKDKAVNGLAGWVRNPVPGTVLVFDSSRFEFDGEDKAKIQRVQKFYSAIREQV
ncbi:MAG: hypothetical protein H7Y20_04865, partial [Bryobacteraceae bacterium]|nr:hypothetical protein [Bryobacteraceae bacterium]